MQTIPITGNIGAEISGLNLKQPISNDLHGALRDALNRYLVLVLRDQHLDVSGHKRLSEVFGKPMINPYAPGPDANPEMTYVIKEAGERSGVFGGGWHTDLSFLEQPLSALCTRSAPSRRRYALL